MMVVMMKSDQLLMPVMLFFLFYLGIVRFNNEAVVVKKTNYFHGVHRVCNKNHSIDCWCILNCFELRQESTKESQFLSHVYCDRHRDGA